MATATNIPPSEIAEQNANRELAAWGAVRSAIAALSAGGYTAVVGYIEDAIQRDGILGAQRELARHCTEGDTYGRPAIAEARAACAAISDASPATSGVRYE